MRKIIKLSIIILSYLLINSTYAQTKENQCSIMHEGTFIYGNTKRLNQVIVIKDNIMTEDWGYGQFIITSNITWINDCEYITTILKLAGSKLKLYGPNAKYTVGNRMKIKITKVKDNKIYYEASRYGYSWDGFLIKKEKEYKE